MQLNQIKLESVVRTAKTKARNSRRWTRAIEKAAIQLQENPYIHDTGNSLLILSPSGKTYEANGICQCPAYLEKKPCWHRASYQLVKRYNETQS
jgi:hypothetical protein